MIFQPVSTFPWFMERTIICAWLQFEHHFSFIFGAHSIKLTNKLRKPRLCSVLLQNMQEAVEHGRSVGENTRRSRVLLLECSTAS